MEVFSTRVKSLRTSAGEHQAETAKLIGVSPQSYSAYENGREPSYESLVKLADHFDVTIDYLLGRTDSKLRDGRGIFDEYGINDESANVLRSYVYGMKMRTKNNLKSDEDPFYSRLQTINVLIQTYSLIDTISEYLFSPDVQENKSAYCIVYFDEPDKQLNEISVNKGRMMEYPSRLWLNTLITMIQHELNRLRTFFVNKEE